MAVFSAIIGAIGASTAAAVGAAATVIGTGVSIAGSLTQAAGQRKAQKAQERAEYLRERAMETEAQRKRMELIRQQQIARATSLAATTGAGASAEGSSAMPGAEGTVFGQYGRGIQSENSNMLTGGALFAQNREKAKGDAQAAFGGTLSATGSGISSLGNSFTNNVEKINRIGGRG